MKLKRANVPRHGLGEHGKVRRMLGAKGVDNHLGTSVRGGSGRHGKGDNFKGKATDMSESPTSAWFEKLGST